VLTKLLPVSLPSEGLPVRQDLGRGQRAVGLPGRRAPARRARHVPVDAQHRAHQVARGALQRVDHDALAEPGLLLQLQVPALDSARPRGCAGACAELRQPHDAVLDADPHSEAVPVRGGRRAPRAPRAPRGDAGRRAGDNDALFLGPAPRRGPGPRALAEAGRRGLSRTGRPGPPLARQTWSTREPVARGTSGGRQDHAERFGKGQRYRLEKPRAWFGRPGPPWHSPRPRAPRGKQGLGRDQRSASRPQEALRAGLR